MNAAQLAVRPLERHQCTYTSCYCEENVYKLLQSLINGGIPAEHLFAVFISNSNESIPLWQQKASQQEDGLVVWDYHVIVIQVNVQRTPTFVWDLDTRLPFPCKFQEYVQHALKADQCVLPTQYARWFRVVAAESFLQRFASDRSHMRAADGSWLQPPPAYACIVAADGCSNTLRHYRDMLTDRLQQQQQQAQGLQEQSLLNGAAITGAPVHAIDGDHVPDNSDLAVGDYFSGFEDMVPSWQYICALASRRRYGVVLSEQQLLGSLLGQ